ncbi:DNA topoisomerase IB [Dyadobacter sandarakinus]|uniref:DNA topoisomerase n=1 Tax=Dyadobacter sandarakinus TaxID=2747268 RepID=A0ABX7I8T7_9BACT|nr:DNA topoisomerase IB [Dyadobacter sandarakinus]QRR02128.1 DNA topoisomerase IB [Dyadobacter sandarakinus]
MSEVSVIGTEEPIISARQIKKLKKDPAATAAAVGLNYITAGAPGYTRKGKSPRFFYLDSQGERVRDKSVIARIRALVLPPAWKEVWVSEDTEGHLQATGIDEAGRKQYRYHPHWNLIRNQTKYYRLLTFSEALPLLREQVERDLRHKEYDLQKVIALVIKLMDKTCIRVGNQRYKLKHGSSGITTLDARAATVTGSRIRFVFTGKKGVKQDISLRDTQLARLVKTYKEMPGKRLFQYYSDHGVKCSLNAHQVNDYIKEHTGAHFSAKDFRTWMGTVTAFEYLSVQEKYTTKRQLTRTLNTCLDVVAAHLGNTRTVCKKYYVHPAVFRSYESGKITRLAGRDVEELTYFSPSEQRVKYLLSHQT